MTALNAAVQGIAIRAVIFQRGLGDHEYEVRIDGSPDAGFTGPRLRDRRAGGASRQRGPWALDPGGTRAGHAATPHARAIRSAAYEWPAGRLGGRIDAGTADQKPGHPLTPNSLTYDLFKQGEDP